MENSPLYQVFVRDYARLCVLAGRILGDDVLAQDAVQESWLRLCALPRLDTGDREKLRHLVVIAVRHTAYNMRRKKFPGLMDTQTMGMVPDSAPLPQELAERDEQVRALLAAMQTLEETDRSILQLQYGEGMDSRQIAGVLGIKAATVRQRARRARLKLKASLEKEGLSE